MNTPRTLFVYKVAGLDTAEIRGRQIARELGADALPLRELMADGGAAYDVVAMSFGLPSVLTPETGYLACGRDGETVLYAHTTADFVDLLRWLAGDEGPRRRTGDACYEAAHPFHISRIAQRHGDFLASLSARRG